MSEEATTGTAPAFVMFDGSPPASPPSFVGEALSQDMVRALGLTDANLPEGFTGFEGDEAVVDRGDEPIERIDQEPGEESHNYTMPESFREDFVADSFANFVHAKGWSQEQLNVVAEWYEHEMRVQAEANAIIDERDAQDGMDRLVEMYGSPDKAMRVLTTVQNMLMPPNVFERLEQTRINGVSLWNDPEFIDWLYRKETGR